MKPSRVISAVAAMLRIYSFAFLIPVPFAFIYEPHDFIAFGLPAIPQTVPAFLIGFLFTQAAALPAALATRRVEEEDLIEREGYLTAAFGWALMPAFGAVPFIASGLFASPLDAYFEAMSGLTTTGFSALPVAADVVAPSLNLWRALLHWIGGIGIIVLSIALISKLTHGGMQLVQAESAGHAKRLRPKLADTARALLAVYAFVSIVLFGVLLAAIKASGLEWKDAIFEALLHLLSAFATGAFSTHEASAGWFNSLWVELALMLVMFVGCMNFQVLSALRRGQWRSAFRDVEMRFLLASVIGAFALVGTVLFLHGWAAGDAARHGGFATVSLLTTTGMHTIDWSGWPVAAVLVLHAVMFIGGSSGSAGGAIKAFRVVLMSKMVARELRRIIHPRAIIPIRFGGRVVEESTVATATAFMFSYLMLWIGGTVLIALLEPLASPLEAAGASAASIGNVGAAFGMFGPNAEIETIGTATKVVMMTLMWFGRLEIFTALLLLYPSSWRN